jgi:hypothetical protein
MMQNLKKIFPHKTPILPLSFATCAIFLVPGTWDISRFKTVSGLLDHPVSFETINRLKLFFECGIPRAQDVGHLCFRLF